ncbi:MAG: hypothetical protein PHD76_10675 [Methylacidiphilales bacterium]|nr:hypothetical protein [Candidatus Methylacidiphilales bacterium]
MSDYKQLAAQFGVVRNSWKRTTALSGMAIVIGEGIGILTVLLLLDWLFKPLPLVRVALWAIALAGIVWFLVRHVLAPLMRKIPDEQIALYIEEHRSELDGVLITAAEYAGKGERQPGQAALIDAVMREASLRSARTAVSHVVDISRLKKYGIASIAGVGLYVLASFLFPNAIGHHFMRVLQPWQATAEDRAKRSSAELMLEPIRFTLSKKNTSIQRGTSFDFEVTLSKSKPADQTVLLYFRPRAQGAKTPWQQLPMSEIEKLNGFKGTLADVSEDLEFYVACGKAKSDTYRITVYDPLIVQSFEMTTHYPPYVKQPDRVEKPSTGDVTALVGSTATLRILTSTPLKQGLIKWSNGQTQNVTVDAQAAATATVSFEVKQDDTYDYTLTDVNGQQAASSAPLSVHAIPDTPPTVTLKSPQSPVLTHPLGEVNFDVEAGDDFGVESLDLVYTRIDDKGNEKDIRVPLNYHAADEKDTTHVTAVSYRLALEDADPPFQYNDAIPYHVEARDAKGQVASSPIGLIIVGYFEHWATWMPPETGSGSIHNELGPDLMELVALVWELNNQKTQIKPEELKKRSEEIAAKVNDYQSSFNDPENMAKHPQLSKVAPMINMHIKKGHDVLMATNTGTALTHLSLAAAILAGNSINLDMRVHSNEEQEIVLGSHFNTPGMTMLEQARLTALINASKDKSHGEEDQPMDADTAQEVADLLKQQDALIAHAAALVSAQNPGAQKQGNTPSDQGNKTKMLGAPQTATGAGSEQQKPQPGAADLATQQHAVAEKTRAAAAKAQEHAAAANSEKGRQAAEKTVAAAKTMEEASRAFAAGKNSEGQAKATEAQTALKEVSNTLQSTDRDKLEAAISDAERQASLLLDKQKDLGADTDTLAKELGNKTPDQRQGRDLQKQAYQQTVLGANAETLNKTINDLSQRAEQLGQPGAIRALTEAQKVIKRGAPQAKMANAVIDLNNASPSLAGDEQKNAEGSLQKIIDSLRAGSDSLAASRDEKVRSAARAAAEAKAAAASLEGKAKGDQPAPAKGDQPAAEKGTQAAAAKGDQPASQGGGRLSEEDRKAAAQKLAYQVGRLATGLDQREIVSQADIDKLKAEMALDKGDLGKRLLVDPKLLQNVSGVVERISDKLEAEMEAKTEARKLFSSQREECPPSYRQFVNKYFEALSQVGRPPEPGGKH